MGRFVPWSGGRVYDYSIFARRRSKDMRREARRLVLQDELARQVERVVNEARAGMECEEVGYMRVWLEVFAVTHMV